MTAEPKVQLGWAALDALKDVFVERIAGFVSFTDPAGNYPKEEREYKDALVALFNRTIDASLFAAPIGQAEAERIAEAVWRVLTGRVIGVPQNLMNFRYYTFLSEAAFRQPTGESESDVVHFARAFGDLLYGPDDSAARVERFNAVMWPIWQRRALTRAVTVSFPTFFLMLHDPAHDIYVRSREFARVSRVLVGYDPLTYDPSATEALGATAYRQVQAIARALYDAFTTWGWQPRDMIDVQTFIFRTQAPAEADPEPTDSLPIDVERPMSEAFDRILASLEATGLHFPPELVANYLLALQTKRFVILTGISGTGKTQMAMAVADLFRVTRPSRQALNRPDGASEWTVNASAFKYKGMTVPIRVARRLPEPALDNRNGMTIQTRFNGQRAPQHTWRNPSDGSMILYLRGPLWEWFVHSLKVGDTVYIDVADDENGEPTELEFTLPETTVVEVSIDNRLVLPVRPDWTDNRGLLGWYNPITERYHRTEFLDFLLAANDEVEAAAAEPGRTAAPFFVVLDEMNLARVEHYFSDFLSAMESGEPIPLHDDDGAANGDGEGRPVPRRLTVPPNLFITGTVNIDETTYMFSAKVLDRAFTIEFNDVDLRGLGRPSIDGAFDGATVEAVSLTLPRMAEALTAPVPVSASDWTAMRGLANGALSDVVLSLHAALAPTNRHFGYRVANEIGRYMTLAAAQSDGSAGALRAALDLALLAKVLPKLHGTQAELGDLIDTLATLAHAHALPRMELKLARMRRRLETQGFTSFIE